MSRAIILATVALVTAATARADEQVIAPGTADQAAVVVNTGPDGICNTTAAASDIQAAPVGQGTPFRTEIRCGTDKIAQTAAAGDDTLALLHSMTERLHREIVFDPDPTHTATTAAESFAMRRGVCQDLSHIFISAARSLDIPARYVGGYFHRADGVVRQEAGHAWAEAFVPDIGWVGFDPANGISPTDQHVRVAIGLDYLGASPVRGARKGGGREALTVTVHVDQAAGQMQN